MKATLISFSYKGESHVPQADEYFDVRSLRNPFGVPALRVMNGKDRPVQDFIKDDLRLKPILSLARMALGRASEGKGVRIAFGCYGGKHRSVAIVEMLATELRAEGWAIEVEHSLLDPNLVHA
jgi:UPF0042 nucleotide-binding protein